MEINSIGNDKFLVKNGNDEDVLTLDEVMFLLSTPPAKLPTDEISQDDWEEFWERSTPILGTE